MFFSSRGFRSSCAAVPTSQAPLDGVPTIKCRSGLECSVGGVCRRRILTTYGPLLATQPDRRRIGGAGRVIAASSRWPQVGRCVRLNGPVRPTERQRAYEFRQQRDVIAGRRTFAAGSVPPPLDSGTGAKGGVRGPVGAGWRGGSAWGRVVTRLVSARALERDVLLWACGRGTPWIRMTLTPRSTHPGGARRETTEPAKTPPRQQRRCCDHPGGWRAQRR